MIAHFNRGVRVVYGIYAWSMFALVAIVTLALLLFVPSLPARRLIAQVSARLALLMVGVTIRVDGLARLPDSPCVLIANHSSYVDGLLLKAALPPRFSFVIKKEMVRVPLAGLLLKRIGSKFVDRVNRHSGALDARKLIRNAVEGQSLVFFPEGTFTGKPGLARFHLGAFVTAKYANLPLVPAVIRGARRVLRADSLWPRPGHVDIEVLAAIADGAQLTPEVIRDHARARMLITLGEPDLSASDGPEPREKRENK
jgi:1-acyl-sn-glycerol-3-phosphate acyltransferase